MKLVILFTFQRYKDDGFLRDIRFVTGELKPGEWQIFLHARILVTFLLMTSTTACTTSAQKFSGVADAFGFSSLLITTSQFDHNIYRNTQTDYVNSENNLHVYLDGDGSPWIRQRWISHDPTARNTMVLELMRQDDAPAILLGRPCYHGLSDSAGCDKKYWTSARYSQQVVTSMVEALQLWLKQYDAPRVVLIGFSGGGTLAVLMAPYLESVDAVVTLAANLEIEAWSEYHDYQPLSESLNPSNREHLADAIKQVHIVGSKDTVVPPHLQRRYLKKQHDAEILTYEGFTHHCCWVEEWPLILDYIRVNRLN